MNVRERILYLKNTIAHFSQRGRGALGKFVRPPNEPPCTAEEMVDASAGQRAVVDQCAMMDLATTGVEADE